MKKYKSAESRARQLAGLSGVNVKKHTGIDLPKVNGNGIAASVDEEKRKMMKELWMQGHTNAEIVRRTDLNIHIVEEILNQSLEMDPAFREKIQKQNLRQRLSQLANSSMERISELMPTISARDATLALGIAVDKLVYLDKTASPEQLHQHVHLHHTPTDIANGFMEALKPKPKIKSESESEESQEES